MLFAVAKAERNDPVSGKMLEYWINHQYPEMQAKLIELFPESEGFLVTAPQNDFHSFFSGYASNAFYAMTFLNLRVRSIMRREMSADDYRRWRWISPTFAFGWASFVALSRIQACRHFLSDVTAGAVAGALIATLYYSFATDLDNSFESDSSNTPMALQFTVSF